MSSKRTAGKLLNPTARSGKPTVKRPSVVDAEWASTWNDLDRVRRRQIRRLVRIGRPQETSADCELALGFAAYQRSRPWYRFFWFWFVPILVAGVMAGAALHPLVLGMVLGSAASAYLVRRNFSRAERINSSVVDAPAGAASAGA